MRVNRGADDGTAGPLFCGAGGAILMPGETTTLTDGLRATAGARTSAKAESRTMAVQAVARGAAEAASLRRLQWPVPLVPPQRAECTTLADSYVRAVFGSDNF